MYNAPRGVQKPMKHRELERNHWIVYKHVKSERLAVAGGERRRLELVAPLLLVLAF